MAEKTILQLGNPLLYEKCVPVQSQELPAMRKVVRDLHDTMMAFRRQHGVGRAIAAPQIGVLKRVIYVHMEQPVAILNPILTLIGSKTVELWDDCMSFPGLLVRVKRYERCALTYRDLDWQEHIWTLEGDYSELLQHEYDHLNGILAVARATDDKAFAFADHLPSDERQRYRTRISRGIRS